MLAVPFCTIMVIVAWLFFYGFYRNSLPHALPAFGSASAAAEAVGMKAAGAPAGKGKLPAKQQDIAVIVGTAGVTITTWVFFESVKPVFGNIGLVGIVPLVVYGGGGYLSKADFNAMPWDVLVLIGGGSSTCCITTIHLSAAITSSLWILGISLEPPHGLRL